MVYIETRTTAQEVLDDLNREVKVFANQVIAGVLTIKADPTYLDNSLLTVQVVQMQGAYGLARMVAGGEEQLSDQSRIVFRQALDAWNEWQESKTAKNIKK